MRTGILRHFSDAVPAGKSSVVKSPDYSLEYQELYVQARPTHVWSISAGGERAEREERWGWYGGRGKATGGGRFSNYSLPWESAAGGM